MRSDVATTATPSASKALSGGVPNEALGAERRAPSAPSHLEEIEAKAARPI